MTTNQPLVPATAADQTTLPADSRVAALATVPQIGCGPQRSCGRIHQFVLFASR